MTQLNHTRSVTQIEDFLGRIGGLFGIIYAFFMWIFGDYVKFEAKFRWIKKFYKFEGNFPDKIDLYDIIKDNSKVSFKSISIVGTYIINYSTFQFFFKYCQKSKRQKLLR